MEKEVIMKLDEIKEALNEKVPAFASQVAPFYEALGWTWGIGREKFIPTKEDIAKTLYHLIRGLKGGDSMIGTGGLTAFIEADSNEAGIEFATREEIYFDEFKE